MKDKDELTLWPENNYFLKVGLTAAAPLCMQVDINKEYIFIDFAQAWIEAPHFLWFRHECALQNKGCWPFVSGPNPSDDVGPPAARPARLLVIDIRASTKAMVSPRQ